MLRNRLGIRDSSLLAKAERDITMLAASEIGLFLPPYNLGSLQAIHHLLFCDLYDWAGDVRTIDLSKGATRFCSTNRIQPEADKLFQALSETNWLEGMNRADFVTRIAEFYGTLNVIHPFREGNGRAQRLLFDACVGGKIPE